MTRYHFQVDGKCLRGQLALVEAQNSQLHPEQAMQWALSCELLHNATLIHDDIQDHDPMRRGQTSVWKKFGISQAINVGDLLIFRSFKLTSQLRNENLTQLLASTAETLVRGQVDELSQICKKDNSYWTPYLEMTEYKTGTLFKLPVHGVKILTGSELSETESQAWYSLGACYQIYDDIRDFYGLKQTGQKQKDFKEKRINALLAWISKDPKHSDLVDSYLTMPNETKERQDLIQEIAATIESEAIVPQLLNFTQSKLDFFKDYTSKSAQEIVLKYFTQSMQRGVNSNAEIQL